MSNSALSIRADHRDNDAMALVEPWLDATADDNTLLEQVAGWYARCLTGHTLPQQALARRSLNHPEQWAAFEIGFADRRLGRLLPGNKTAAGKELRVRLTQLGVLRDSGHARYSGSITFPLRDAGGTLVDIYGRKIGRNLARGSELHTYLPGARAARHLQSRGLHGERYGGRRRQPAQRARALVCGHQSRHVHAARAGHAR